MMPHHGGGGGVCPGPLMTALKVTSNSSFMVQKLSSVLPSEVTPHAPPPPREVLPDLVLWADSRPLLCVLWAGVSCVRSLSVWLSLVIMSISPCTVTPLGLG